MLFKRKKSEAVPEPPHEEPEDDDGTDVEPESGAAELDEEDVDRGWHTRAQAVIPGGASTGSKRAEAMFGSEDELGPTHFLSATGCTLTTPAGRRYIDCSMALGAVTLGYADSVVSHSVADAAVQGSACGLSSVREVLVAERLCDVIPCAEQVRFLKTGAEGVAAAVRIARVATGRTGIIGCGYFGWLDWASDAAGVPPAVRQHFTAVPFDDVAALRSAVDRAGGDLAAIVLEPVVERFPSDEWIAVARELASARGAVLIFDEVKTGFRLRTGGFQELSGVTPDLAVFGKAMANGFPLSAVVGRRDLMDAAQRTWISSTLASESTALAAAAAVLEWHERAEVCESLWSIGAEMRAAVTRAIEASGVEGATVEGIDPMWLIRFADADAERHFLAVAREHGVLFKRGAYNFASLAHDEDALAAIERAASEAFVALREHQAA